MATKEITPGETRSEIYLNPDAAKRHCKWIQRGSVITTIAVAALSFATLHFLYATCLTALTGYIALQSYNGTIDILNLLDEEESKTPRLTEAEESYQNVDHPVGINIKVQELSKRSLVIYHILNWANPPLDKLAMGKTS